MIRDLQRIQIKIASDAPAGLSLDPFLAIFARWRKEPHPAEWVDLADYAHLARGPGIMLIGQRCSLSFDLAAPGPGILYAARKGLAGSYAERVASALRGCLELSKRLTAEPEYPREARLRTDSLEIRFNDRLETPHLESTDAELRPAILEALSALYGAGEYGLTPQADPREFYGFAVRAKKAEPLAVLLERVIRVSESEPRA